MDVVNGATYKRIESKTRHRLEAGPAEGGQTRAAVDQTLREVAQDSLHAVLRSAPVPLAIRAVVSDAQTYAVALAAVPGAAGCASLQALADVGHLARLGSKGFYSADDVRATSHTMLSEARDRARAEPDWNRKIVYMGQALKDAETTAKINDDGISRAISGLVPRFLQMGNAQLNPENRGALLTRGAGALVGLLTVQPQIMLRAPSNRSWPGAAMALPPSRRDAFVKLWKRFDGKAVRINRRYENETYPVHAALERLLHGGKLDQKDAHGDDLLSNLVQLSQQPLAQGLDRDVLLAQTIVHVSQPGRSMSQGTKLTCAAATVSYQLAHNRPSEYARLVCGLSWPEGQVRLAGGDIARRDPESLIDDGAGRSVVERLVQSALMQVGGGRDPHATYRNLGDVFFDRGGQYIQNGMFAPQMAKLEEAVGEGRFKVIDRPSRETLLRVLKAGGDNVPVALNWLGSDDHWVLARGCDDDRVYFRNPHGYRHTDRYTLEGIDHRLHEDGVESMPIETFVERARSVLERQA